MVEAYSGKAVHISSTLGGIEKYRSPRGAILVFPRYDKNGDVSFGGRPELTERANQTLQHIVSQDIYVSVIDYENTPDKVFDYGISEDGTKFIEINTHRLEDDSFKRAAFQAKECVNMLASGVVQEGILMHGIAARLSEQKFGIDKNETPDVIALEFLNMLEKALKRTINPADVKAGKFKLKQAISEKDYTEIMKANDDLTEELKSAGGIVGCNFERADKIEKGFDKDELEQDDLKSEIATYRTIKTIFRIGAKNGVHPQVIEKELTPNRVAEAQLKMIIDLAIKEADLDRREAAAELEKAQENPQNNLGDKSKNTIID